MVLRTLIAATTLLAAACFVDNRPIGASASVATTNDASSDASSSTGAPTTGPFTIPSTTGSTSTGTPGDASTSTSGSTTAPATSEPATTNTPGQCSSLAKLGGVAGLPPCGQCVTTHCCEPFDACAETDACVGAWSCISAEPCQDKWPSCPGAIDSFDPLQQISACIMGPCADFCLVSCTPQTAACAAEPACEALELCLSQCATMCTADDVECLNACASDCYVQHPAGEDLLQAKTECLNAEC